LVEDIAHYGKENIFHNARKIKSMMERNGMTLGYMNYDDPPTFYSGSASPTGFESRFRGT